MLPVLAQNFGYQFWGFFIGSFEGIANIHLGIPGDSDSPTIAGDDREECYVNSGKKLIICAPTGFEVKLINALNGHPERIIRKTGLPYVGS